MWISNRSEINGVGIGPVVMFLYKRLETYRHNHHLALGNCLEHLVLFLS